MSNHDPAIAAAQRAGSGWYSAREVESAREALKPIRAWAERHSGECSWIDELLDELAPMIYTTEELER